MFAGRCAPAADRPYVIRCGGTLPNLETFEELEQYLREFVNFGG